MQTPRSVLSERIAQGLRAAYPELPHENGELIVPTASPEKGDYQCNRALQMAKAARANPRAVAEAVLRGAELGDVCSEVEVAGPGFINFRLAPAWVGDALRGRLGDPRLGVAPASPPKTVVVDFSSPNVAKPMHVGHIRSTIIGDAVVRTLRFLGHSVVGDNHLGDWGTQYGMLILGWRELLDPARLERDPIGELTRLYKAVRKRCDADEAWAERARQELVKLQAGDAENLALWEKFRELSRGAFERVYQRLDVRFDTWHGESFYHPMLADVVRDLTEKGIAQESEGALAVFFPDGPEELRERPFLIQKKDGGYLYATTDLAAIRYRAETYQPDAMVYLTDGRQQLHFKQLFETARRWGYTDVELLHVWFGSILGPDGRPLKTREGDPVELEALLDEAEERALAVVREKQPELDDAAQRRVARAVGLGAVKYADLSQNRTSDYVFSWEKMLAMQGNTAPYLQYAYVRINSILERAGVAGAALEAAPPALMLGEPTELALGKALLRFSDVLEETAASYKPNLLTSYLFELASRFSGFYENCPVVQSEEPLRASRLALCHLTARTLERGLSLLGIEILPRM